MKSTMRGAGERPRIRLKRSRAVAAGVAIGVVGAMVGSTGAAYAAGLDSYPSDPSEAEASVIDSSLLGTDLAGAAHSEAGFPTDPGPNQEGLSLDILGGEVIDLGGLSIPADQLIDFGQLGALYSESTATDELNAHAISGLLSGDGSVTLDGDDADFGAAEIDLLSLFDEAGVNTLTDEIVDQALLRLGAGGAEVIAENGEFLDPDGVGGAGQYRVAEASAFVHSPLIEQAAGQIYDTIGLIDDEMENQVGSLLDLTSITGDLPAGVDLSETTIESNMQDEIFAALLDQPITTNNEFLTVDFSTGTATFHLDQLLSGELRPDQPTGLNAQNPNTELIDDEIYPMIAERRRTRTRSSSTTRSTR
ncbi:choice-of-anchor G family protein [Isoptericola sp. BMS4]|uniref:choice-of-anchor G family protein n=1 Tax=Isoptericola sp. BMS4 TaxID=2527875 RepID=UPI0014229185|nr:choice-of-anchor G family protein [Isoptericola sp. BMS4]